MVFTEEIQDGLGAIEPLGYCPALAESEHTKRVAYGLAGVMKVTKTACKGLLKSKAKPPQSRQGQGQAEHRGRSGR